MKSISYPIVRAPTAWPSGTEALPGVFFGTDTDTGFYRIGAGNVGLSLNGVKAWDFAATVTSFTGANSTSNTTLTVENTSNAAAASHAIIEAKVGGTTSTGDPQLRLTIPSGTSWHVGVDNSIVDQFHIGTGTTVGGSSFLRLDASTSGANTNAFLNLTTTSVTLNNGAAVAHRLLVASAATGTLSGTTQVTSLWEYIQIGALSIAQSGGAVTVDKATQLALIPVRATTSVTLTESSALRVIDGAANTGTVTRTAGLIIEALTRGTTNPQILLYNGSTEHTTAVANSASISCIDLSADNASFSFTTETAVAVQVAADSTHTWQVRINGTAYKIMLTTA